MKKKEESVLVLSLSFMLLQLNELNHWAPQGVLTPFEELEEHHKNSSKAAVDRKSKHRRTRIIERVLTSECL